MSLSFRRPHRDWQEAKALSAKINEHCWQRRVSNDDAATTTRGSIHAAILHHRALQARTRVAHRGARSSAHFRLNFQYDNEIKPVLKRNVKAFFCSMYPDVPLGRSQGLFRFCCSITLCCFSGLLSACGSGVRSQHSRKDTRCNSFQWDMELDSGIKKRSRNKGPLGRSIWRIMKDKIRPSVLPMAMITIKIRKCLGHVHRDKWNVLNWKAPLQVEHKCKTSSTAYFLRYHVFRNFAPFEWRLEAQIVKYIKCRKPCSYRAQHSTAQCVSARGHEKREWRSR